MASRGPVRLPGLARTASARPIRGTQRNGERSGGSGVFRRKPDGVPGPVHLPGLARTAVRTADPEGCRGAAGNGSIPGAVPRLT